MQGRQGRIVIGVGQVADPVFFLHEIAFVGQSGLVNHKGGKGTMDDLQHRGEQVWMGANRYRSGIGNDTTHWRTGTCGMT